MTLMWQRRRIGTLQPPSPQLSLAGFERPVPAIDALFFAIRPTEAAVEQIEAIGPRLRAHMMAGSRLLASSRLHVSLHGFGRYIRVPEEIVHRARAAAARLRSTPFTVVFDRLGTFGRGDGCRPLVLTASDGAVRLHEFHHRLGLEMAAAGLGPSAGRAYTPHLTLAYVRDVVPGRSVEPIAWTIDEFVLVRSVQGRGKHVIVGHWRLTVG